MHVRFLFTVAKTKFKKLKYTSNLQHSIVASRVFNRTVVVNGIDTAMIQEPWYTEGLNIPGYILFCLSGIDRLRACILATNMNIWRLPGFSSRDPVAVIINYNEGEAERRLVVCSAPLLYDSEDPPPPREFEEVVRYCEEKKHLISHSVRLHTTRCGVAPTAKIEGRHFWNF